MQRNGYTMIEMMVVVAIMAVVMAVAIPSLQSAIISSRARAVAESIQSGILLARAEAIKRNAMMRFQLVTSLDNACAPTSTSRLWVVTQYTGTTTPANLQGQPWAKCGIDAYLPPDQEEPCPTTPAYSGHAVACTSDPFIAFKSTGDAFSGIDISTSPATTGILNGFLITFGPVGQLVGNYDGSSVQTATAGTITINPSGGASGRRYRVTISINGGVKLCNPDAPATDAMACG
jgi:type IV fimbrial biogenesis protein FimT